MGAGISIAATSMLVLLVFTARYSVGAAESTFNLLETHKSHQIPRHRLILESPRSDSL
jgi:hypothetical protein